MSNNYVPDLANLNPGDVARSADVNDRYTNVVAGFDKLPAPAVGKQGFSDPVPVGTPTDTDHAVTKDYMENTWLTPADKTQLNSLNLTNLNTVATNIGSVNTTATDIANVNTVAGISANVTTVATNNANVNTVATNIAAVNDVSTNMASVLQVLTEADNFGDQYLGVKASDPTLDNDGDPLQAGALYFSSTLNTMRVYDGAAWAAIVTTAVLDRFLFTATGGQTVFSGVDDNGNTLNLVEGNEVVMINGVTLEHITDYTRTISSITLTTAAALNDEITVLAFGAADIADVVPASSGGTFTGSVEFAGGATVSSNSVLTTTFTAAANTFTGPQRGTVTADNDLTFDLNVTNNFKCTPTATGTLTFTNITAGQSGNIWLDNSGGYAISAAATTYISSADLTTISTAGVYFMSYYADGTNVLVSVSRALTSAGA